MKTALVLLVTSATFAVVGCNALLANDPGVLGITDETGTEPAPTAPTAPVKEEDGGVPTSPPPVAPDAGLTCEPCTIANGIAACQGGACVVGSCSSGYADCNAKAADGCEADLSKATTCGACAAACSAAAPVCAPTGATFACTTGCTAAAPLLCGNACVDPTSNVENCGGCDVACPAVADATIACQAGACTFTCAAQRHACAGKCVPRTDPTACGAACAVCPVLPGARATCANDACVSVCTENLGDCNANPADGCEAKLIDDPANCGACGNVCPAGSTCKGKMCKAAH